MGSFALYRTTKNGYKLKKVKVYLEAAKLIADHNFSVCCLAIDGVTQLKNTTGSTAFNNIFAPNKEQWSYNYFGPINKENQEARILALLLMQEIEDSGGL